LRPHVSHETSSDALPTLTISGLVDGDCFALGVSLQSSAGESILSPTDSVLTLCAKSLGGEIHSAATAEGGSSISLRYPVRLEPTLVEAAHAQ